jgi:hypothetical protein
MTTQRIFATRPGSKLAEFLRRGSFPPPVSRAEGAYQGRAARARYDNGERLAALSDSKVTLELKGSFLA